MRVSEFCADRFQTSLHIPWVYYRPNHNYSLELSASLISASVMGSTFVIVWFAINNYLIHYLVLILFLLLLTFILFLPNIFYYWQLFLFVCCCITSVLPSVYLFSFYQYFKTFEIFDFYQPYIYVNPTSLCLILFCSLLP